MAPTKDSDTIEEHIKRLPRADMQAVCLELLDRIKALEMLVERAAPPKDETVKTEITATERSDAIEAVEAIVTEELSARV